jgi:hypothetical protein
MHPRAPFARHLRRSHGCRIPRRRRDYERHNSHMERRGSIPRASHPAACRGVATNRRERSPRSRKRSWTRPQQGVLASDTCRVFGTTPCGSPRLGLFSTSALFQAENDSVTHPFSFSFAALAGTKYGAARRVSKRSRYEIDARAGPASVETSGLSQKDSSPNWSPMMPGTNPLT